MAEEELMYVQDDIQKMDRERHNEYNRRYKESNRDIIKAKQRAYYEKNREKILEKDKKRRNSNPMIKEKDRIYRELNRDRIRKNNKNYYLSHIEQERERNRRMRTTEERKKYEKDWHMRQRISREENNLCIKCGKKNDTHKLDCSSCLRNISLKLLIKKFIALQKISNKQIPECAICGEKNIFVLTKHHKKSIPKAQLKMERSTSFNGTIANGKVDTNHLEVRCHNCNFVAEYEKNRCFSDKELLEKKLKEYGIIEQEVMLYG